MSLVSAEVRGAVRIIVYANAPFGTMTAAGAAEMFSAVAAASEAPSVRVIIITGGLPGIFIRHLTLESFLMPLTAFKAGYRVPPRRRVRDRRASTR